MSDLIFQTVHTILNDYLGLFKKSASWVLQVAVNHLKTSESGVQQWLLGPHSAALVGSHEQYSDNGRISCFLPHPGNQKESMQWVKKGQPGSVIARVQLTRSKQMVLVFFNAKGFIYTNISSGKTVNVNYMKKALARFLVIFR
jgi:hypothetical protein